MNDKSGESYGTCFSNPRPSSLPGTDSSIKAACVEFKCAGNIFTESADQIDDVPTFVNIRFRNRTCTLEWVCIAVIRHSKSPHWDIMVNTSNDCLLTVHNVSIILYCLPSSHHSLIITPREYLLMEPLSLNQVIYCAWQYSPVDKVPTFGTFSSYQTMVLFVSTKKIKKWTEEEGLHCIFTAPSPICEHFAKLSKSMKIVNRLGEITDWMIIIPLRESLWTQRLISLFANISDIRLSVRSAYVPIWMAEEYISSDWRNYVKYTL